jgi:hypothetical protein
MTRDPGYDDLNLGATGKFPDGRLNDDDQGELRAALAVDRKKNRLLIQFGKPVAWLVLTREGAEELAKMIERKCMELVPKSLGGK